LHKNISIQIFSIENKNQILYRRIKKRKGKVVEEGKCLLMGITFFVYACCVSDVTLASGGGTPYANGAEGFFCGLAPPPGLYLKNYFLFYKAEKMRDNSGDEIGAFDRAIVWADIIRFIFITKKTFLGASYGTQLFIPYVDKDLRFNVPVGPKNKRHYTDRGIPCIIYTPYILGYHLLNGRFHCLFATDIYIPVGSQQDNNLANVETNYWTIEPLWAFTFFLTKRWDISSKLMYSFNTEQQDCPTIYGVNVDRRPGQEFHLDYTTSYEVAEGLRIGITGYYYKQTTDDDYDIDNSVPAPIRRLLEQDETNKGQVFAIGPGVWYHQKNWFFSLRAQWELAVKNRPDGKNLWAMFIHRF